MNYNESEKLYCWFLILINHHNYLVIVIILIEEFWTKCPTLNLSITSFPFKYGEDVCIPKSVQNARRTFSPTYRNYCSYCQDSYDSNTHKSRIILRKLCKEILFKINPVTFGYVKLSTLVSMKQLRILFRNQDPAQVAHSTSTIIISD